MEEAERAAEEELKESHPDVSLKEVLKQGGRAHRTPRDRLPVPAVPAIPAVQAVPADPAAQAHHEANMHAAAQAMMAVNSTHLLLMPAAFSFSSLLFSIQMSLLNIYIFLTYCFT